MTSSVASPWRHRFLAHSIATIFAASVYARSSLLPQKSSTLIARDEIKGGRIIRSVVALWSLGLKILVTSLQELQLCAVLEIVFCRYTVRIGEKIRQKAFTKGRRVKVTPYRVHVPVLKGDTSCTMAPPTCTRNYWTQMLFENLEKCCTHTQVQNCWIRYRLKLAASHCFSRFASQPDPRASKRREIVYTIITRSTS